jgi:hypothetical protein
MCNRFDKVYKYTDGPTFKETPVYRKVQQTIAANLRHSGYEYSIESLSYCLSEEPRFVVYSMKGIIPLRLCLHKILWIFFSM